MEDFTFPMALEVKDGEHKGLRNYQAAEDLELYVPDTLDLEQGISRIIHLLLSLPKILPFNNWYVFFALSFY